MAENSGRAPRLRQRAYRAAVSFNTYLIGLDPTYMLIYDAELYHLWVDITQGDIEGPSASIDRDFGARYVLTDLRHSAFLEQAEKDPGLVEVCRDREAVVFHLAEVDRSQ